MSYLEPEVAMSVILDNLETGNLEDLRQGVRQLADRLKHAEAVCAEAYVLCGEMLDLLGLFGTEKGDMLLDNLSEARMVHDNIIPWNITMPSR